MNKEFAKMPVEEKMRILRVDKKIAPQAEKWLKYLKEGNQFKSLFEADKKNNIYGIEELKKPIDYSESEENVFVREKDGTMLLNVPVGDLQKKAVKIVLGQLAKKLLSADLTGIKLPVFLFQPRTYLHQYLTNKLIN